MDGKLISVAVSVRVRGRSHRLRVVAEGVRQAVEMAHQMDDAGRASLVLPIDGDRFFVDGLAHRSGEILPEDNPPVRPRPAAGVASGPVSSNDAQYPAGILEDT